MSNLRRVPYTRPIPAAAEIFTRKGERFARFKDRKGKTVEAPLTEDGKRVRLLSRKWYGEYRDADGTEQCVPLSADRTAAEQMLAALVRKAELGKAGVSDPYEAHHARPLAEHLDDFERELTARDNAPRYVALVISRLRSLLTGCGFVFIHDLSASRAMDWLADLRRKGRPRAELPPGQEWFTAREAAALLGVKPLSVGTAVRRQRLDAAGKGKARRFPRATVEALQDRLAGGVSVQTTNDYLSALKSFGRWLVKDRRTGESPFAHLSGGNARVDRRHDRRELEADELRRLLAAARDSGLSYRGLTGADRCALYAAACGTGYRAGGLASLTPESFDLAGDVPTATLAARRNKSRVVKVQPLPADVAELLRGYLAGKPAGQPVWGGTWGRDRKGAEMLRIDLDAAGIPYAVAGPDGPLYADFHALRHSYLTLGGRAGIDLRTLQELAGHSTPTLTARYSHRRLYDLAGAVEKLPNFLPGDGPSVETLRATGTDGREGANLRQPVESFRPACATAEAACVPMRRVDDAGPEREENAAGPNPLELQGVEAGCVHLRAVEDRAGDGARTHDSHVGNVALYH
jgi:integrase